MSGDTFMRNIMLHAVVMGELDASRALERVIVAGHAFGLHALRVRLEGPRGALTEDTGVHPRTHQWVVSFTDREALREAGIEPGVRVRAVAADLTDLEGCYSSAQARVEVDASASAPRS